MMGTPYLVKEINVGGNSDSSNLTNVNGTLFFSACTPANGWELWRSDGTEARTILVKDIDPGSSSSGLEYFANVNGTLFFHSGLTFAVRCTVREARNT